MQESSDKAKYTPGSSDTKSIARPSIYHIQPSIATLQLLQVSLNIEERDLKIERDMRASLSIISERAFNQLTMV